MGPNKGITLEHHDQGTGYYRDWSQTTTTSKVASSTVTHENDPERRRKHITIDESRE
jgi:hypothetical protein